MQFKLPDQFKDFFRSRTDLIHEPVTAFRKRKDFAEDLFAKGQSRASDLFQQAKQGYQERIDIAREMPLPKRLFPQFGGAQEIMRGKTGTSFLERAQEDPSSAALELLWAMHSGPQARGPMTPKMARNILKVGKGATEAEIKASLKNILSREFPQGLKDLAGKYKANVGDLIYEAADVLSKEFAKTVSPKLPAPKPPGPAMKTGLPAVAPKPAPRPDTIKPLTKLAEKSVGEAAKAVESGEIKLDMTQVPKGAKISPDKLHYTFEGRQYAIPVKSPTKGVGGVDLSKAKPTKEFGFQGQDLYEVTGDLKLSDFETRSITTPEYRDYDVNLKAGRKVTEPITVLVKDINDPQSPFEVVDGWHRWRQAVANNDETIPAKFIYKPKSAQPPAKGGVGKELESLAKEARKYKSAEEFADIPPVEPDIPQQSKPAFRITPPEAPRVKVETEPRGLKEIFIDFKKADKLKDPEGVSRYANELRQRGYKLLEGLQEKAAKAGYTPEKFAELLEGKTSGTKELAKEYQSLLTKFSKRAGFTPGEDIGKVVDYMPRREETSGIIRESLPGLSFDLDSSLGRFLKKRTNKNWEYVKDPLFAGKQYVDEVVYQMVKPYEVARNEGITVEAVRKIQQITDDMVEKMADSKNLDNVNVFDEFREIAKIRAEARGEKFKVTRLSSDEHHIPVLDYAFNKIGGQLKKAGVYENFRPVLQWRADAQQLYREVFEPLLQKKDYARVIDNLNRIGVNSESLNRYILLSSKDPSKTKNIDLQVNNLIQGFTKKKAYREFTDWIGRVHFEDRNLREVAEWMTRRLIGEQVQKANALQAWRQVSAMARIGKNIRSNINNLLETRRIFIFVNKKNAVEALLDMKNPANVRKYLEKYGQEAVKLDGAWEQMKKVGGDKLSISKLAMAEFNVTEAWKNAVFLDAFEREGITRGLAGKELTNFVVDNFNKYAHRGGMLDKVGIFRNEIVSTLLQFSEYTFKELWNTAELAGKARPGKAGSRQAQLRLLKKFSGDAVVYFVFSALYGMTIDEALGFIPGFAGKGGIRSPIISVGEAIIDGGKEILAEKREAEETGKPFKLNPRKVMMAGGLELAKGTIPAGTQAIGKTGRYALTEKRGYEPTWSGNVRFPAPAKDDLLGRLVGYTMGPFSTKESRDYYGEERQPLGSQQSEAFRSAEATQKGGGRDVYAKIMDKRAGKPTILEGDELTMPKTFEERKIMYKDALSTIRGYQKRKTKTIYGNKLENLQDVQEDMDRALDMKQMIEREYPEEVFRIEVDTYKSDSGSNVEDRSKWAYKKLLEAARSGGKDGFELMRHLLLKGEVLTKKVAESLAEMGVPVDWYISGGKIRRLSSGSGSSYSLPKPTLPHRTIAKVTAGSLTAPQAAKIKMSPSKYLQTARSKKPAFTITPFEG